MEITGKLVKLVDAQTGTSARGEWKKQQACAHITSEPGVYRIEAYRRYLGRRRGWIFSNPIYVR